MTQPTARQPAINNTTARGSAVSQSTPHLRYQWVIVGAVFIYNASVILSAATSELSLSVAVVSGATAMFFAIGGLSGFTLSPLLNSTDIRWFYVAGGIVGAASVRPRRCFSGRRSCQLEFGRPDPESGFDGV